MAEIREQIRRLRFPAILSSERRRYCNEAADTMEKMLAVVEAGHAWQKAFFGPESVTPSYQNQCEDDLLLALGSVLEERK